MNQGRSVREIALDRIEILNARERNQKIFKEMVASIKALGLKKPITVASRNEGGEERYVLVCGQGRVEAFHALGQKKIPALVIEASDEDAFVMSLVENIARRNPQPRELLQTIRDLEQRGYDAPTIARKTALEQTWVRGILQLLAKGEHRLISAVETGRIPLATAIAIVKAGDDDGQIQEVLQAAYESGVLRGKKLITARRLVEKRRHLGKSFERAGGPSPPRLSSSALVRAYNQEVERQKLVIRKADMVQNRLAFISAALSHMLADENFVNLLRAEGLDTLPKSLDERIRRAGT
jgi:ParB family chromosome partitioning protein